MKKKSSIWLPALLLAVFLTGCQQNSLDPSGEEQTSGSDTVNLTVWGAEEDEEEVSEYDLGYFFSEGGEEEYVITAPSDQVYRQLFAQYPTQEAISRSSIMVCFDEDQTREINQMWINVRCCNIHDIPAWVWMIAAVLIMSSVILVWKNYSIHRSGMR